MIAERPRTVPAFPVAASPRRADDCYGSGACHMAMWPPWPPPLEAEQILPELQQAETRMSDFSKMHILQDDGAEPNVTEEPSIAELCGYDHLEGPWEMKGHHVGTIKRDQLTWACGSTTPLTLDAMGVFSTVFHGHSLRGAFDQTKDSIKWDDGDVWDRAGNYERIEREKEATRPAAEEKAWRCREVVEAVEDSTSLMHDNEDLAMSALETTYISDPKLCPRLCGKCAPMGVDESWVPFPNKDTYVTWKMSAAHLKSGFELSCSDLPQGISDFEDLLIPDIQRSAFTRCRDEKFRHLSGHDLFHLEANLLQHKVKVPKMKDAIERMQDDFNAHYSEMRHDLKTSAVRIILGKPVMKRQQKEVVWLIKFLYNCNKFFRQFPVSVLLFITNHLEVVHFVAGESLFEKGDEATGIYIVLKGVVSAFSHSEDDSCANDSSDAASGAASQSQATSSLHRDMSIDEQEVLGVSDVLEDGSWPIRARVKPERLSTAIARGSVSAAFLPAGQLVHMLKMEALRKQLHWLQELFPATKGLSEKELLASAQARKDGKKLHELFEAKELPRHSIIFQEGEKYPVDMAHICLVVSGRVQLKGKGDSLDIVSAGAMLGEEALSGDIYQHTAVCRSHRVRVLMISVLDYVVQFMGGRLRVSKAERDNQADRTARRRETLKGQPTIEPCQREQKCVDHANQRRLLDVAGATRRRITLAQDIQELSNLEWVSLQPKRLPKRVAPLDKPKLARTFTGACAVSLGNCGQDGTKGSPQQALDLTTIEKAPTDERKLFRVGSREEATLEWLPRVAQTAPGDAFLRHHLRSAALGPPVLPSTAEPQSGRVIHYTPRMSHGAPSLVAAPKARPMCVCGVPSQKSGPLVRDNSFTGVAGPDTIASDWTPPVLKGMKRMTLQRMSTKVRSGQHAQPSSEDQISDSQLSRLVPHSQDAKRRGKPTQGSIDASKGVLGPPIIDSARAGSLVWVGANAFAPAPADT